MHNAKSHTAIAGIFLLALTGCSGNPFSKANYTSGTLGAELNPEFGIFVSGCNIQTDTNKKRDYIPSDLWRLAPDAYSTNVELISKTNSRLLFLFPFTATEKNNHTAFDPNLIINHTTRALKEDGITPLGDLDGDDVLPITAAGTVLYRQSCSSYINAQANAKINFGLGQITSALDTEFKGHQNLLLYYGSFESPLHRILKATGPARRYARLLFLTNFFLNQDVSNEDPFYLREFRGAILTRAKVAERKTNFSIDEKGAGAYGVFSTEVASKAGFGENSKLDGAYFLVFMNKNIQQQKPQIASNHTSLGTQALSSTEQLTPSHFEQGPSLDTIRSEFKIMFSEQSLVPTTPPPIVPGNSKYTHTYEVDGVPAVMCNDDFWIVEKTADDEVYSKAPNVITTVIHPIPPKHGFPGCRFEFEGDLDQKIFKSAPGLIQNKTLNAHYLIKLKAPIRKNSMQVNIDRSINLLAGPYPKGLDEVVRVKVETTPRDRRKVSWFFNVPVVDENDLLADLHTSNIRYLSSDSKVSCNPSGPSGDDITVQSIKVSNGEDFRSFDVLLQGTEEFNPAQEKLRDPMRTCRFSMEIALPIKHGASKIVVYPVTSSVTLEQPFTLATQP